VATAVKKKKVRRNVTVGIAHVKATFNNTIVTITDVQGNCVAWSSAGARGFKGCPHNRRHQRRARGGRGHTAEDSNLAG